MKTLALVLLMVVIVSGTAAAYDLRSGNTVVIERGQTLDEDLAAAGSEVVISGSVRGDVNAAGQTVRSEGNISGTINAAASDVDITGTVGNDAQLAGGTVDLGAVVGDNASIFGGQVRVGGDARVTGDLVAAGGEVSIRGNVGQDLRATGGTVRIGGTVGGDAIVNADKLILLPGANIRGDLRYTSPSRAEIQRGATVQGDTIYKQVEKQKRAPWVFGVTYNLLQFLALLAVGLVVLALLPVASVGISEVVRTRFGWSLLWGFIFGVAIPAAAFIIMLTVIGIPLALIILALYFVMLYIGQIFAALAVGELVLARTRTQRRSRYLAFIVGLVILTILELIPIIGWLVSLVVVLTGFGAILIYMYNKYAAGRRTEGELAAQ